MSSQHQSSRIHRKGRSLLLALGLLFLAIPVFADDTPAFLPQVKSLNFSDGEVQNLEEIVLAAYQTIVTARADVTADRAVLTRQLLLPNVTVKDVEPTMRHSIDAEMKVRMSELDRQLKIRKLIGDKRWAKLMDLAAILKKQNSPPDGSADDSQTNRIINVLRILGS